MYNCIMKSPFHFCPFPLNKNRWWIHALFVAMRCSHFSKRSEAVKCSLLLSSWTNQTVCEITWTESNPHAAQRALRCFCHSFVFDASATHWNNSKSKSPPFALQGKSYTQCTKSGSYRPHMRGHRRSKSRLWPLATWSVVKRSSVGHVRATTWGHLGSSPRRKKHVQYQFRKENKLEVKRLISPAIVRLTSIYRLQC